jgi:hypothetical protein
LYIQSKGMKMRLAPTATGSDISMAHCNISGGTFVDATKCWAPLYQAAAARWGNALIDAFTPIHEPSGSWFNCAGGCAQWSQMGLGALLFYLSYGHPDGSSLG